MLYLTLLFKIQSRCVVKEEVLACFRE